jgi:hypothetical protein
MSGFQSPALGSDNIVASSQCKLLLLLLHCAHSKQLASSLSCDILIVMTMRLMFT